MTTSATDTGWNTEIIDIVNDQDEIVGQASRTEVHVKKLLHREVGVLVHDGKGRVLAQQRGKSKKVMPLFWTLSAVGHVPAGMAPEAAAHKELVEELGVDAKLSFYAKEFLDYGFEAHFAYGYYGEITDPAQVVVETSDIEQIRWITAEDLDAMVASGEQFEEYSLRDFRLFFSKQLQHG